jgi:Alkylmercury lyase
MGQYIPALEWSERALVLRKFVFDFWAETGRGPNLRQAGAGTGLSRRDIVQAYKELQTGIVVVVDQDSPNCDLLKAPPYSAFPSQVEMYLEDEFHSFIGCAHEAVAVSNMPHFRDLEVRLESYCACCLEPITFWSKNFEIQRYEPFEPVVHVATPVWDWVHDDMKAMCDNVNLVFDREHAARFEEQIGRRGVIFTMDQVRRYVEPAVGIRGWDYHWPSQSMNPERLIDRMRDLGIDLSPWGI